MTLWSLTCSAFGLTHLGHGSSLFNPEAMPEWPRDSIRDVDIVTGCFLLIDTALWRELGGFDPAFFMYAEEADLCLRAKVRGARPGISPEAEIVHMGATSEAGADKIVKTTRGRVTLMRKHWTPAAVAIGRALLLMVWSKACGFAFRKRPQDAPARREWSLVWKRRSGWQATRCGLHNEPTKFAKRG